MPDPLDVLRLPLTPLDPDPRFAVTLRARLERAIARPLGEPMSATTVESPATAPAGAAVPYLAVRGAREAIDWYVDVLGARLVGEPIRLPDGTIGHAELALGTGVLYLSEESPEYHAIAPAPEGASVSLMLTVDDVDSRVARVVARGGTLERGPDEAYGTRNAWVRDPFRHRWNLQTPLPVAPAAAVDDAIRAGDVAAVTLRVPDVARAADFYADALGWDVAGTGPAREVVGAGLDLRLQEVDAPPTAFCSFVVADLATAVASVRAAGGTAAVVDVPPHGSVGDCADDQGWPFALLAPPAGATRPTGSVVAYLIVGVADSRRFRDFTGRVLGWRTTPGRMADGWEVTDVAPMVGLHGGAVRGVVTPMYRVPDVAAAVARVRAAGGTATDPERMPYGVTATCSDDQGVPFWLGAV